MLDSAHIEVRGAGARGRVTLAEREDPMGDRPGDTRMPERTRALDLPLALEVALNKYALHISLERQERALAQRGRKLTRAELWEQIELLSYALREPYRALSAHVANGEVVCVREQTWAGHKAGKHFWVLCTGRGDAVHYRAAASREEAMEAALAEQLGEYRELLVLESYETYQQAQKSAPHAQRVLSLMSIREALWELRSLHPECASALSWIDGLLHIDADLPEWHKLELPELRQNALAYIADIRREHAEPLRAALAESVRTLAQRAATHERLRRTLSQLAEATGIELFVQEPRVPLCSETVVRAFAPSVASPAPSGLKTLHAAEMAAVFLSLIDSAKCAGIEPSKYVRAAAEAAARGDAALLPHQHRAAFSAY
jgi:hypothetical protein